MSNPASRLAIDLKPCLAELLRTCVHPPSLLLRVELVFANAHTGSHSNALLGRDSDYDRDSGNERDTNDQPTDHLQSWCFRLAVSDGQLQMQAVLARHLYSDELWELQRGDLIEVTKFQVRLAPRSKGQGRIAYLAVRDCEWFASDKGVAPELGLEGGFFREEADMAPKQERPAGQNPTASSHKRRYRKRNLDRKHDEESRTRKMQTTVQSSGRPKPSRVQNKTTETDGSDDESFETIAVSQSQLERRRLALRHIQQNQSTGVSKTLIVETNSRGEAETGLTMPSSAHPPEQICVDDKQADARTDDTALPDQGLDAPGSRQDPKDSTTAPSQPQPTPLSSTAPLHTLSSLLSPPTPLPRRSYCCTIFATVSWVSPSIIHKPNTPYPPKRHIKIHDPTISHRQSGITVAVFIDAKNFRPNIGTIALFKGLVMQRWEGEVILNKYASLGDRKRDSLSQPTPQEEWFIHDEKRLGEIGFDVHGMRAWWEARTTAS